MKNKRKGFTLVEVLIVVVIIAILASLIVPRMLMQTDKAKAAEALQMVGAIRRAAERYYDFNGSFIVPSGAAISSYIGSSTSGDWSDLGLSDITAKSWAYGYHNTANSFQVWAAGPITDPLNSYIHYDNSYTTPGSVYWECNGVFKPRVADVSGKPLQSTQGCTI